ncbi:MAG: phosphate acyltransferase PlsX [Evtepia sp.]|uniref:phosphate acyltransferase PlsX n=1 Tax=Evtepia sp. TaxID=2773933 RepID=UPI002A7512F9|nr:phosphate acyltransferase PlsX [Evtepia sp.]MDY3014959.1 phosphate acyltransferase PlsX [Evtepia sp.]
MKIIVDAMGGDHAPMAPVEGALKAVQELGVEVILTGRAEEVLRCIEQLGHKTLPKGVEIAHASEVIEMEDNPARAFKEKKDSSMTVGLNLLKEGNGEAFVSAGSTGALLSAATLLIKRIRGIRRAALAPVVPTAAGSMVLIDCGATAECTPEYLLQFAFMGSYYAKRFLGREEPKVALLNIGAEPSKGMELQKATHALLTKADQEGRIHFVGNIEGREAISQGVDVLVTDGYTGNIFLKTVEGSALLFSRMLKGMFMESAKTKLAALMMKKSLGEFKKTFDPNEVGGTAMLGISKPVVKAHGSSNGYAFYNAIRQAMQVAQSDIVGDITANVEHMRLPTGRMGG